jgi:hypothetical protein
MSDNQNFNSMDSYKLIRSLGDFLKTEVKVSEEMIETKNEKGSGMGGILNPGCSIEVDISNTAPVGPNYPMVVFIGVGLGVQFPKAMHASIKRMTDEFAFETDLIDAPQDEPFRSKINRVDNLEFEAITIKEQDLGYVLFPGKTIKYKFKITYKACPDIKQIKLYAEGMISTRHLFHHVKEIPISKEKVIS